MNDPVAHCKRLDLVPDRVAYVGYYQRLQASGLGPRIVAVTGGKVCLQKLERLPDWVDARSVDGRLPDEPRRAMGLALIELLEKVHELGLCHRDTHIRNFVVRAGAPLLVDPKYAIESRGRSCYDLKGPEESGVEIAREHLRQANVNQHGVWWEDADPISESLTSTFGTLAELRRG
jgi:hypothetical protein